ncbi:MAG: adenylate/guanylate cyclase domain-containing protein, partial [Chitinophagales bacterium]
MSNTRQLAAILFADIEGYTALMQADEANANLLRDKLKKTLEKEIVNYDGRILKLSGDGALCIFNSAIEAVRSAIEIQKQMQADPKVPVRIGIHTGDVMFEDGDVYGDGVNVASRIESFAVAGGVFISDRVYADIKNQKDISTISLGKYELKNVSSPVEIFAISNEGLIVPEKNKKLEGKGKRDTDKKFQSRNIFIAVATVVVIASAAIFFRQQIFTSSITNSAEAKSIGVLPFENLSSNKDDEYFADGMCDEIFTQLSKIGSLNVLSRTSTLQFKDTKKTMKEIGSEIGADVLLAGSVQKSNDQVRINVQLIDAKNNKQL